MNDFDGMKKCHPLRDSAGALSTNGLIPLQFLEMLPHVAVRQRRYEKRRIFAEGHERKN